MSPRGAERDTQKHIRTVGALLAFTVALGFTACGSAGRDAIVARVNGTAIMQGAVEHWAEIIARDAGERASASSLARRRQALALLIADDWLRAAAAEQGLARSKAEVAALYARQKASYVLDGESTVDGFAKSTGRAAADIRSELAAGLAADALRQTMYGQIAASADVSDPEVVHYYKAHLGQFRRPEHRHFYIVERLHSAAIARRVMREVRHGKSMSAISIHESFDRPQPFPVRGWINGAAQNAIFTAPRGVLVGPVKLSFRYAFFEVTRITPSIVEPLVHVRGAIRSQLAREQHARAHEEYLRAWRAKWTVRTDCLGKYVIPGCRQYQGAQAPLGEPFAAKPWPPSGSGT